MRGAIGAIRQGRYQCRCVGRPTSRRRGQVVCRLLERADGGDRIQVRGHAESELTSGEGRVPSVEGGGTRDFPSTPDPRPFSSIGTKTQEAEGDFIMNVMAIDIGGTHVKILATGQDESRRFVSGPTMTPKRMVAGVKKLAGDWKYQAVSIGYPGMVVRNRPLVEPHNLGRGWVGF